MATASVMLLLLFSFIRLHRFKGTLRLNIILLAFILRLQRIHRYHRRHHLLCFPLRLSQHHQTMCSSSSSNWQLNLLLLHTTYFFLRQKMDLSQHRLVLRHFYIACKCLCQHQVAFAKALMEGKGCSRNVEGALYWYCMLKTILPFKSSQLNSSQVRARRIYR